MSDDLIEKDVGRLILRLSERRHLRWNAPLKGGGYAKLVDPADLEAAIIALGGLLPDPAAAVLGEAVTRRSAPDGPLK